MPAHALSEMWDTVCKKYSADEFEHVKVPRPHGLPVSGRQTLVANHTQILALFPLSRSPIAPPCKCPFTEGSGIALRRCKSNQS